MLWMHSIAFKSLFTLKGAVEHHVSIRRGQTAIYMNLDVQKSWNLTYQSFHQP